MDASPPLVRRELHFPLPLFAVALIGASVALAGGYWDDAWHTERGRDSFFIAPHIALYSGVTAAGAAFALWLAGIIHAVGRREALTYPPILLGLVSVAVTLGSGPIDDTWHRAFGRDAVIWSPPHTLGIVAMASLGLATLLAVSHEPGRRGVVLRTLSGGFVIAAFNVLLMEYETDVPQFSMVWYLPVLGLTSALAMGLLKLANPDRYAAALAAVAHLGYVVLVALFLELRGFDAPLLPLLFVPALVLDLARLRGWPLPVATGGYVAALVAVYLPSLNLLSFGISLDGGDLLIGIPLALLAVAAVLALSGFGSGPRRPRRRAAAAVAGAVLLLAPPAAAHDPGQGKDAGTMALQMQVQGKRIEVMAQAKGEACDPRQQLDKADLVARRAGQTLRSPLSTNGCHHQGAVQVSEEGRWFVYVELDRGQDTIESWVPVKVGQENLVRDHDRYAYYAEESGAPVGEWVAGVTLYALMLALLVATVVFLRRRGPGRPQAVPVRG